jgi:hypothetical protein
MEDKASKLYVTVDRQYEYERCALGRRIRYVIGKTSEKTWPVWVATFHHNLEHMFYKSSQPE